MYIYICYFYNRNARRGDLTMMTIMVESDKDKMIEEWSNILQIADATVVDKLHSRRDTGKMRILMSGHFLEHASIFNIVIFKSFRGMYLYMNLRIDFCV